MKLHIPAKGRFSYSENVLITHINMMRIIRQRTHPFTDIVGWISWDDMGRVYCANTLSAVRTIPQPIRYIVRVGGHVRVLAQGRKLA